MKPKTVLDMSSPSLRCRPHAHLTSTHPMQDHYGMAGALLMPDSLTHALNMEEKADPGVATRPPADPEARLEILMWSVVVVREGFGGECGHVMSSMRRV